MNEMLSKYNNVTNCKLTSNVTNCSLTKNYRCDTEIIQYLKYTIPHTFTKLKTNS